MEGHPRVSMNAQSSPSSYSSSRPIASSTAATQSAQLPLRVLFQPQASENQLRNHKSGRKMVVEEDGATRMEIAKLLLSFQSHGQPTQQTKQDLVEPRPLHIQYDHSSAHFALPRQATPLRNHSLQPPLVPPFGPTPAYQGTSSTAPPVWRGVPSTLVSPYRVPAPVNYAGSDRRHKPTPTRPPSATTSMLNSEKDALPSSSPVSQSSPLIRDRGASAQLLQSSQPARSGPSTSATTSILEVLSVEARPNPLLRPRGHARVNPPLDLRLLMPPTTVSRPGQQATSSLHASAGETVLVDGLPDAATSAEDATSTWRRPPGQCRFMGCTKKSVSRERCVAHGGGRRCSVEGCTRGSQRGGKCRAHGGGDRCSVEDCERSAQISGLCKTHGGRKCCSYQNCARSVHRIGMCKAHSSQQAK